MQNPQTILKQALNRIGAYEHEFNHKQWLGIRVLVHAIAYLSTGDYPQAFQPVASARIQNYKGE